MPLQRVVYFPKECRENSDTSVQTIYNTEKNRLQSESIIDPVPEDWRHGNRMKDLTELNEIEQYLKSFLKSYPRYTTEVIGLSDHRDEEYRKLMDQMRAAWKISIKDQPFFLENTSYHLDEEFFIAPNSNVSVIKNLRYMPLTLHSHQFIELNYVLSAKECAMITRHGRYELSDGDIILCPPGLEHCFHTQNDQSIIIDIFIRVSTFDTAFFNLLNQKHYLSALFLNALYSPKEDGIIWHCGADDELSRIILAAYEEYNANEKYKENMLEILVMEFFLQLMRNHENQAVSIMPATMTSNEQFQAMINYLHSHYQTMTLTKLSEQYNYSERQVIRLFNKYCGKSFSDVLLDIRMKKAVELLKNPSLSTTKIAEMLGFSSKSYFIRVFRKYYGKEPDSYR